MDIAMLGFVFVLAVGAGSLVVGFVALGREFDDSGPARTR